MSLPHEPFYRHILKDAWDLTRRYRSLWIFGIAATFVLNTSAWNLTLRNLDQIANEQIFQTKFSRAAAALNWGQPQFWPSLATLAAGAGVLAILIWLMNSSQGALIWHGNRLLGGKTETAREAWNAGKKKFWPLAGIMAVAYLLLGLGIVALALPALLFKTSIGYQLGWYIASLIIFIPLTLFISCLSIYSSCAVMLKNMRVIPAIRRGLQVFRDHWITSAEMACILFLIAFAIGTVVGTLALFLGMPLAILLVASYPVSKFVFVTALILLATFALVFLVGASVWFTTFQYMAWTALWSHLTAKEPFVPKVVRVFSALAHRFSRA